MTVGELPPIGVNVPSASNTITSVEPGGRWSTSAVNVPNNDNYKNQYIGAYTSNAFNRRVNILQPSIAIFRFHRIK